MAENIIHLVLARLPDAPEGVKGISLFLVPKYLVKPDGSLGERNDLYCASIEHKLGIHASPTAVLSFGEKDGAIGYLVGEPNRGLACMFTMMNHARLNVGLEGVAISERAYQRALAYARERIQVHGGTGFIEETGASQYLRDARISTIYEGTTGIQAHDLIGRKLAHEDGATMRALIASIGADGIVFDHSGDAGSKALAGRIAAALDAATDWILENYRERPQAAAAGSVPYLKLAGTVLSAWLLARAAGQPVLKTLG